MWRADWADYARVMSHTTFDALPDNARVWVFAASRPLEDEDQASVRAVMERLMQVWKATSWIEKDYRLKAALGLGDAVMMRTWDILREGVAHRAGVQFARYSTPSGRKMDS